VTDSRVGSRPRPEPGPDDSFWWQALREHRLAIQRCADCRQLRHPPGPYCARCGSPSWDTITSSGEGEIYSFVVPHYPPVQGFESPYVVVLVRLKEGVRVVANLAGQAPEDVAIGQRVELQFIDVDGELTLPCFRPA
jgi:uncharacterized protein